MKHTLVIDLFLKLFIDQFNGALISVREPESQLNMATFNYTVSNVHAWTDTHRIKYIIS